ncbi:hypothetical protein TNCV_775231 [Trichonephila clavipes]|nr:hypothetical protein TNCV_775231 [Trichonephila clavipes]
MSVCKCIVPLRHEGILTSRHTRRKFSLEIGGKEYMWDPMTIPRCPHSSGVETEPKRTVICTVLKATSNDRRTSSPLSQWICGSCSGHLPTCDIGNISA